MLHHRLEKRMASKTRSCRAPDAQIVEIVSAPVLAVRSPISNGLELWLVKLRVGYFEYASPETKKEMTIRIRLILGRTKQDNVSVTHATDVMIVECDCFESATLVSGIIAWAQAKWSNLYPDPPATTQTSIVRWMNPPVVDFREEIIGWADDIIERFWDQRLYDESKLEWNVGKLWPRVMTFVVSGIATMPALGFDKPTSVEVEFPVVAMLDDSGTMVDQSSREWLFWPTTGVQIGSDLVALQVLRKIVAFRSSLRPGDIEDDPFAE